MLLCNSCTNNVCRCSNQCPVTWNQKLKNKVTAKLILEADLCSILLFKGCDMMVTVTIKVEVLKMCGNPNTLQRKK